jgi:hypothetical protein
MQVAKSKPKLSQPSPVPQAITLHPNPLQNVELLTCSTLVHHEVLILKAYNGFLTFKGTLKTRSLKLHSLFYKLCPTVQFMHIEFYDV